MVVLSKTAAGIFGFCLLLANAGFSDGAPTTGHKNCPPYHFHDHGTDYCEHCRDICDSANHTGTLEQCWDLCKPYAQIIWTPKPPQSLSGNNNGNNDNNNDNTTSSEFPPGAWIGLVVLGLVCVVVTTGFLFKRKTIIRRIKRNQGPAMPGQTAVVLQPLNASRQASTPHGDSLAASACGGSEGTAGIQEEGEPCPEGPGNHSYHILPQPGVPESEPLMKQEPNRPIPVTSEDRSGDREMTLALPYSNHSNGPYSISGSGRFTPAGYTSFLPDLDSTEPKTLQSSLEPIDCLIDGASGGMPTTQL